MAETVEKRRERLEQELAAARSGLERATQSGDRAERERLEAVVRDAEQKLERLILAIEIERQSDA